MLEVSATKSILIFDATGRTGLLCLRKLGTHETKPAVHAFCCDSSKLSESDKLLCTTVYQGDSCNDRHIADALLTTKANTVILSSDSTRFFAGAASRTECGSALARVLRKWNFRHVRVLLVSRVGAGDSRIVLGNGIGQLVSLRNRSALRDHTGQEAALSSFRSRTTIVRATTLADDDEEEEEDAHTGKLVEFGDFEKPPTFRTRRADLVDWIVQELCGECASASSSFSGLGNRVVNLTNEVTAPIEVAKSI